MRNNLLKKWGLNCFGLAIKLGIERLKIIYVGLNSETN